MRKSNYHVTQHPDGGWQACRVGSSRASARTQTQSEARKLAGQFARKSGGGEVRTHGRDGKIRDSDTIPPANDPCPPKDKVH